MVLWQCLRRDSLHCTEAVITYLHCCRSLVSSTAATTTSSTPASKGSSPRTTYTSLRCSSARTSSLGHSRNHTTTSTTARPSPSSNYINHLGPPEKPFHRVTKREVPPADNKFIRKIMKLDPRDRPTAEQLLADEWFTEESEDTRDPLPEKPRAQDDAH